MCSSVTEWLGYTMCGIFIACLKWILVLDILTFLLPNFVFNNVFLCSIPKPVLMCLFAFLL